MQVNFAEGSTFDAYGKTFNLLQAHFHTPSEHYIDGAPYPMSASCSQAEDGQLAVIGVMLKGQVTNRRLKDGRMFRSGRDQGSRYG